MNKRIDLEPYQGWTNAKTWCIALYFDNDKILFKRALEQVKYGNGLRPIASEEFDGIFNMAPWCWTVDSSFDDVNFKELEQHYQTKIDEGC